MKIGLIQSQGIGDVIIALPIAAWYAARGCQVFWPINEWYLESFHPAAPYVEFIPLSSSREQQLDDYFYNTPMELLQERGCDRIFPLDMRYAKHAVGMQALASALKFDEYKYAVAEVPFAEKWNLKLERDRGRELMLHQRLNLRGEYVCVHSTGSNVSHQLRLPETWRDRYQVIQVAAISPNPLDWLHTIENAAKRIMIDSLFANLTEQMNIAGDNYLILRSGVEATPVFRNGWTLLHPAVQEADGVFVPLNAPEWAS